jgi:hypothetical protein
MQCAVLVMCVYCLNRDHWHIINQDIITIIFHHRFLSLVLFTVTLVDGRRPIGELVLPVVPLAGASVMIKLSL